MNFRHFSSLIVLLGLVWAAPTARAQTVASAASAETYPRILYLIRHGAYDQSIEGDQEKINGLTPLGIAQARLIAARLRGMTVTFDSLVSSTYTRARQTADVINQSLPQLHHDTTKLLCECMPRTRRPEAKQGVTTEDIEASEKQLNEVFAQYFTPASDHERHDILVCHGNVIRYLVTRALGVDTQAWLGFTVAHCSLTIIRISPGGSCQVLAVGDTGHLPPNLLSGLTRGDPQLVVP